MDVAEYHHTGKTINSNSLHVYDHRLYSNTATNLNNKAKTPNNSIVQVINFSLHVQIRKIIMHLLRGALWICRICFKKCIMILFSSHHIVIQKLAIWRHLLWQNIKINDLMQEFGQSEVEFIQSQGMAAAACGSFLVGNSPIPSVRTSVHLWKRTRAELISNYIKCRRMMHATSEFWTQNRKKRRRIHNWFVDGVDCWSVGDAVWVWSRVVCGSHLVRSLTVCIVKDEGCAV